MKKKSVSEGTLRNRVVITIGWPLDTTEEMAKLVFPTAERVRMLMDGERFTGPGISEGQDHSQKLAGSQPAACFLPKALFTVAVHHKSL